MRKGILAICISVAMLFGTGIVLDIEVKAGNVQIEETGVTENTVEEQEDIETEMKEQEEGQSNPENTNAETIVQVNDIVPISITGVTVDADADAKADDGFIAGKTCRIRVRIYNSSSKDFSLEGYELKLADDVVSVELHGTLLGGKSREFVIEGCEIAYDGWGEYGYDKVYLADSDGQVLGIDAIVKYPISAQGSPAKLIIRINISEKLYANTPYPFSVSITNISKEDTVTDISAKLMCEDDNSTDMEPIGFVKNITPVKGLEERDQEWFIKELKPQASVDIKGTITFLRAAPEGDGYGANIICWATGYGKDMESGEVIEQEWHEVNDIQIRKCNHKYADFIVKATTTKDGSIVKKCTQCGTVLNSTPVYRPRTVTLSKTDFTYNGKVQTPSVSVTGSDGKIISPSNYTVSYASGRKNIGHYSVRINFKGNYEGSLTKSFNINPKGTKLSKVKAAKKKATVKWKKQGKNVKGYQIQYSMDKQFSSGVKTKTASSKKSSVTIKKLKSKKVYYVRIRTYQNASGGKCYSEWSAVKKVKIK